MSVFIFFTGFRSVSSALRLYSVLAVVGRKGGQAFGEGVASGGGVRSLRRSGGQVEVDALGLRAGHADLRAALAQDGQLRAPVHPTAR